LNRLASGYTENTSALSERLDAPHNARLFAYHAISERRRGAGRRDLAIRATRATWTASTRRGDRTRSRATLRNVALHIAGYRGEMFNEGNDKTAGVESGSLANRVQEIAR